MSRLLPAIMPQAAAGGTAPVPARRPSSPLAAGRIRLFQLTPGPDVPGLTRRPAHRPGRARARRNGQRAGYRSRVTTGTSTRDG